MEFVITTDLAVIPQSIAFNAEELKDQLCQSLEHYNHLVITEGSIREAKADRAKLNKLKEAMEAKRKEIKAACNVPYESFKRQYDEVLALVQKPIQAIDSQLKAFEETRKADKLQEITAFWNQHVGEHADYISFKQAFQKRWLNTSVPMSEIQTDIMAAFLRTGDGVNAIRALHSDFEMEALEEFATSNDLSAALRKIQQMEARRKAEQEKRRPATPPENAPPEDAPPAALQQAPARTLGTSAAMSEKTYTVDFRVTGTRAQLEQLKAFLKQNRLPYGPVPKEEIA